MSDALVASGLSHRFDDVVALDDASLTADVGEITAVIGPNGSGKTTMLRAIAGLLRPDRGTIEWPTSSDTPQIGYLPQQPAFRPGHTVRETLSFYARLAGAPPDAPDRTLELVGLEAAADSRVEDLSGGMIGLLGIAQAVLGDPPAIVLDEPTTGLDPGIRRHIFERIADLPSDDRHIVLASHDLGLVDAHANEVVLLDRGRVVDAGSPAELADRYDVHDLEAVYDAAIERDIESVAVRRGDT